MAGAVEDIPDFDESLLSSAENPAMLIFQYLHTTEDLITKAPVSLVKSKQGSLVDTLLRITTSPLPTGPPSSSNTYPFPVPGRAIRNAIGRCFILLYTRGETRTLFDTVRAYIKAVSEPHIRNADRESWKTAAWSCIGMLMGSFGSQVMSCVVEIVTLALKTAKMSSSTPLMRFEALTALCKTVTSASRAVTESLTKDTLKYAKSCLSDKTLSIQRVAADILVAMYLDPATLLLADIETILLSCVKSLEGADAPTRQSLSNLVAHLLVSTQTLRLPKVSASTAAQTPKKDGSSTTPDDGDDLNTSSSAPTSSEPPKPLCTVTEMLQLLSAHYTKLNTSRKIRVGIFNFYSATLFRLGPTLVESNYNPIVSHFASAFLIPPPTTLPIALSKLRYDILLTRTLVSAMLRDLIGVRMLSEQGQIQAIKELAGSYLKRWPAMLHGHKEPPEEVLVVALMEVEGLLVQLGDAPSVVQEALLDPLITLLSHPALSVRVSAARALRTFCHSTPLRLPKAVLNLIDLLQRDLNLLLSNNTSSSSNDIHARTFGHAIALSALVSLIPLRPLYVSYDVPAKVLDTAISLLRSSASHSLSIAETEVGVAWSTIAALMALGPGFVKPHLTQLLVLWRNALPKPTTKDALNSGNQDEWRFLLAVRESALGAVLAFLKHNAEALVTLDVARRVSLVVGNALAFANQFVSTQVGGLYPDENETSHLGLRGLTLRAREEMLRKKVFECFSALVGFSTIVESTQISLLQSAIAVFAGAETGYGGAVQSAIASSNAFKIWQSNDGFAFGVTFSGSVVVDDTVPEERRLINEGDTVEVTLRKLLRMPVLGAAEHDNWSVCSLHPEMPPPPPTAVVDAAIDLFAQLLPLQDTMTTLKILTTLMDAVRSPRLERNVGRKTAVFINATVAITRALRVGMLPQHLRGIRDTLGSTQVSGLLAPFLKDALIDGDLILRTNSSEALGRLASLAGTNFLTSQTKLLFDQVVSNRDPYARAGCALTFGAIHTYVGGLAAGPLLKTTIDILKSLSNDPHPVVHYWALSALARVVNAASLSYGPYVSSTLALLLKLYLSESHEDAGGTTQHINLSGKYPAYPAICQIIDAVINVLGPDIQDSTRTRTLVLNLMRELSMEQDERICIESIQCFQHFLMFSPEHVDIPELVSRFRSYLSSTRRPLKLASINALYQLVQKDAVAMSKLGGDRLVEDLFGMLDDDSSVEGVKSVIKSWLSQTVVYNPSAWIDLCQRIMSRTTASQRVAEKAGQNTLRDDEGESLNVGASNEAGASSDPGHLTSRWRTQLFALQCLHTICRTVASSGRKEHLDVWFARRHGLSTSGLLISRVPDLIKMAFTASTAYVADIRLEGLVVLRDVIQIFASSPDPAYEDALLLEQHQAPITAALTPAFSGDSTPEILASAVHACATFVGCGVVQDVNRMGRILKLLVSALEQSKGSGMLKLGDTDELSPNASAMLRISTLSAWAELQVASTQHTYLVSVIKPHRSTLASLWIAALRDYASVRIDSESLQDNSPTALDTYSSLGKEVLLPFYASSWSKILAAATTFMEEKEPYILAAMNGRDTLPAEQAISVVSTSQEASPFFFVIFGLVFEALSKASTDFDISTPTRQPTIIACLSALKHLVLPEYSGKVMMEPTIFDEFIGLCYRLAMTEGAAVQTRLIEVMTAFAVGQSNSNEGDMLAQSSAATHCLRICAHLVRNVTPNSRNTVIPGEPVDKVRMITAVFASFAELAGKIQSTQREDIRGVAVLLYGDLLKDQFSETDLVGPTLPALKALLSLPPHPSVETKNKFGRLIHGLVSSCLLNIDEMRGREGAIPLRIVQNNLLASVLVLSVIPPTVKIGLEVVEQCCFTICQKLSETNEVSLTAAHCAKTLTVAAGTGNVLLRQCTKFLIPGLIEYIAKVSPAVADGSVSEASISAISEVWKAFVSFFNSTPEALRTRVLCVLLPTMTLLLSDTQSVIVSQTIKQLLTFATSAPAAFKEATAQLDPSAREVLEQSLRKAVAGSAPQAPVQPVLKPQISLRSF